MTRAATLAPHHGSGSGGDRLVDGVYRQIRWEILTGALSPHQHLVEADLAARLNVSRTPVRETMQRLAADGLVASERRRWVVYAHSRQEVRDIFEVRMALEGYAARLACERATDDQIEAMAEVLDGGPTEDPVALADFVAYNSAFHDAVVAGSHNVELAAMVERNLSFGFNVRVVTTYSSADIRQVDQDHGRIVAAIRSREADLAEQRARDHVSTSLRLTMDRLLFG